VNHKYEDDITMMQRLLKEGDICLDIGACYGIYAYWMSKSIGKTGRVIAVEPMIENFSFLTSVVASNNLENVELLNTAIWDKSGFVNMLKVTMYTSRVSESGTIKTMALTIDDVFKFFKLTTINFIKVDGGSSLSTHTVLGCEKLIEKYRPRLLLECDPNKDLKLFNYLENLGYICYYFDGRDLNKRDETTKSSNYFFIWEGDKWKN